MEKPFIQRRYKLYRQALLGKITVDQYMDVFNQDNNDSIIEKKYFGDFFEIEKWWVACITKQVYKAERNLYGDSTNSSCFYSNIYMNKYKDLTVLKTAIIQLYPPGYSSIDNVINAIFLKTIRHIGFNQCEFIASKHEFVNYNRTPMRTAKILIPPDKTEDDLVYLLGCIDKYNKYVNDNPVSIWDTPILVQQAVKNIIQYEKYKNVKEDN